MKFSSTIYFITICGLSKSQHTDHSNSGPGHNHLTRRAYGPIAAACSFETKLKTATTEPSFNQTINDCTATYSTLLAKDPSQKNAVALQEEISYIKEQFNAYKSKYFSSNPPDSTPTSSSTADATSTTPAPAVPSGQKVAQRCELEKSISKVIDEEEFDDITTTCNKSYKEILSAFPSRSADLITEWQSIVNRIQAAKNDFAKAHPNTDLVSTYTSTSTSTSTYTYTSTYTSTPTAANNSTISSSTPTPTPAPAHTPTGQAIAKKCDLEANLKKVSKADQFDSIVSTCSKAYLEILTVSPSKNVELGTEWQVIINQIQKAKVEFAKAHLTPDVINTLFSPQPQKYFLLGWVM